MGRPVWKQAALKVANAALVEAPVVEFYARSTVSWRSATVSVYPWQWIISGTPAASASIWNMHVNNINVCEFSIARSFIETTTLVIPWNDGIRFSDNDRVGWRITTTTVQLWATACFIGASD